MKLPSRSSSATVVLIDSHQIVRDGLRSAIELTDGLSVVGEASTAHEAMLVVDTLRPDIAVLDMNLADRDGIELCRDLAQGAVPTRCVIFTSDTNPDTLDDARAAGAAGYLLKTESSARLITSLERIASGESLMNPPISMAFPLARANHFSVLDTLTQREREIFELLADGVSNRQIAEELFLAQKTVKNYVSNLLMKLGLHRRAEATALAARFAERRELQRSRLGYTAA